MKIESIQGEREESEFFIKLQSERLYHYGYEMIEGNTCVDICPQWISQDI